MANRTSKDASTVKGTNPQYLVEKIIRTRVYDSRYWKEECFALSARLVVDKGMALRYIGGIYAGNVKPTPFLCLTLKMLQIQPERNIIVEFIQQEEYKYIRALGALYLRLTFGSIEIYKYLEPLYNDYRKLRYMNKDGRFELMYMDDFIDQLLHDERCCDVQLPRLQKRQALEEVGDLEPYVSALEGDLEKMSSDEEAEERQREKDAREAAKKRDRPKLVSSRVRGRADDDDIDKKFSDRTVSLGRRGDRNWDRVGGGGAESFEPKFDDRSAEKEKAKEKERVGDKPSGSGKERSGRSGGDEKRRRSPEGDRRTRDGRGGGRDEGRSSSSKKPGGDEEREIAEANALRSKLGMAPLQR